MSHAQTIEDLLSDSLIQAVMRADGVQADKLRGLMKTVATRVAAGRRPTALAMEAARSPLAVDRRALPTPAVLPMLPPAWLTDCAAGVCG